jgi:Heterokaryon incompatibility protein (HET)
MSAKMANQSRVLSHPPRKTNDSKTGERAIPSFSYEPLDPSVDCIRLIQLETADDPNSPVECKLIHRTFAQKPKYEALSYRWGDESVQKTIWICGMGFEVGENLWDALRHLRMRKDTRCL